MSNPAPSHTPDSDPAHDIEKSHRPFNDDELRNVTNFQDAFTLLSTTGETIVDATEELGTGFIKTDNKKQFVDTPFIALQWSFHEGDYGDGPTGANEFVVVFLVTKDGGKYIITDGSTGIYSDLRKWTDNNGGRRFGMMAPNGLTESPFKWCDDCKSSMSMRATECTNCHSTKIKRAATYYIK